MRFTVAALLYGEYPHLAERLLSSLLASDYSKYVRDFRIGLNAICGKTRDAFEKFVESSTVAVISYEPLNGFNACKYPLMRRMIYHPGNRVSDLFMWFDDDSYLHGVDSWWLKVMKALNDSDLVGDLYTIRMRKKQHEGVRAQPWYTGKTVYPGHRMRFATGGWWAARSHILTDWNYPFPELRHNGGDSILGELCRQQGYRIRSFKEGVAVNKAPRRGKQSAWVWDDYSSKLSEDLSHHDFLVQVTTWGISNTR